MLWTTVIATIIFGAFYWAFVTRAIDFENLVTLWGLLKPRRASRGPQRWRTTGASE